MNKILIYFTLFLCSIFLCNIAANAQLFPPVGMQGSGSENSPWQIKSAEELHSLALYVNTSMENANSTEGKHYRIMNDIDLTDFLKGNSLGWLPIGKCAGVLGNVRYAFKGYMHGGGHVISGLRINRSIPDSNHARNFYIGLFGVIENATIDSLGVEVAAGDSVKGDNYIGILVGYSYWNSYINQCYTKGKVVGQLHVGGLAGWFAGGSIENCYADAEVHSSSRFVGGLLGQLYYGGSVRYCYAINNVTGHRRVGGLIGFVHHSSAKVTDCFVAGGLISGTGSKILGESNADSLEFNHCYAGSHVIMEGESGVYDGSQISHEELKTEDFFTNIDNWSEDIAHFSNAWAIVEGRFPVLRWQGLVPDKPELVPPTITTNSLPNDTINNEYYAVLSAEGDSVITWSLGNGMLPDGLSLFEDGIISGVPTVAGTYVFAVRADNDAGSDTAQFSITIIPLLGVDVDDNDFNEMSLLAWIQNGILNVSGLSVGKTWYVYSVVGTLVYKNVARSVVETWKGISSLPQGIYIVKSGNRWVKVPNLKN
ncbi:MAG: Ig domain-containing protein [Bacteroidales bacterium]|jgi:hypothetical protein|nr:Ig domain-containing protein [Bacteroidales bacterium]